MLYFCIMHPHLPLELSIDTLDTRARGATRIDHTRYICDGALPGEKVHAHALEKSHRAFKVTAFDIIAKSPHRIEPACQYFSICGGCQLQHLNYPAQIEAKLTILKEAFHRNGQLQPITWLPALTGTPYHYRRRARLGVHQCTNGNIVIGFRRKHHTHIVGIQNCLVLEPRLAALLTPLHALLKNLSCKNRIPKIEVAAGDEEIAVVVRHLVAMTEQDHEQLQNFSRTHKVQLFTQAADPDSAIPVDASTSSDLAYSIEDNLITWCFLPTDFFQANTQLNQDLIGAVLSRLELNARDNILELFCGIGNFSLPIARSCAQVLALDGHSGLIQRAQHNADRNNISNVQFIQNDLRQESLAVSAQYNNANKLLLDPPREGAIEVLKQLAYDNIERIVYVSCDPYTLARDLNYLTQRHSFHLESVQLVDMFPQTIHTETIALLLKLPVQRSHSGK